MLALVLGISLIGPSETERDFFSRSENFKSMQVCKLSLKTLFAILSDSFDPLKTTTSVKGITPQSVSALVMVFEKKARIFLFYIICKIVQHLDWLVLLFSF